MTENASTQTNVILTGATGMIGGLALRDLLRRPEVSAVTSVGRRPIGFENVKLREITREDFRDYRDVAESFENQDLALFCLGVYTGTVSDDVLREVTLDYLAAFAETLHERSPGAAFCLLSGQGADPTGKSRFAFARYKGAAETALLDLGFPRVHVFRPGYIYPVVPRREPNLSYRIMRALYPVARLIYPDIGIPSDDLARAMVHAGLHGTPGDPSPILENRDIRELAGKL